MRLNKKMEQKNKPNYIFPDFLATWMSKVDLRTQLEASMLSMTLLIVGLILSTIYSWFYLNLVLWFKIVISINAFFGVVFMWSFIVTTYQQYLSYMDAISLKNILKDNKPLKENLNNNDERRLN
jgi:hypothetical protein